MQMGMQEFHLHHPSRKSTYKMSCMLVRHFQQLHETKKKLHDISIPTGEHQAAFNGDT